ncbi:hypothetical protein BU24DRAFT_368142 [Aaosphaeria arxii CBS 175.79]|uniref:Zn(2)-C6 fungal-type domain-containing protein n=1 Tax=Aaosphaeria arxii CBS 175.79 TaxID=1450172 RepID=A0A6A5XYB2_9PLEO|nr:uncharacterized protein BU24DRAFT_368142 [Aaosphaeria arxii CBS 175.79]KAF2017946.1 hypothetical protein BU24DRAFT_368142 [Aaosphaeria arxii CBS 175.79]
MGSAAVGPHDGRKAKRKRCNTCVKRKIKCHGGVPCEYCRRTNQKCEMPAKPATFKPVFVMDRPESTTAPAEMMDTQAIARPVVSPSSQLISRHPDHNIPYFFMVFLPMNVLVNDRVAISIDLLSLIKTTPGLRDTMFAISIQHRKQQQEQQGLVAKSHQSVKALQFYNNAVKCMQAQIKTNTYLDNVSSLWTTFFLGLFELMRDSTGMNWLSHFLHGTCTILRLQQPHSLLQPGVSTSNHRTFFLATRIFEIARSLIYSSPTFLWEPEWTAVVAELWRGENALQWHPKEALFDILPSFSELSIRAHRFSTTAVQPMTEKQRVSVRSLAEEGLALQEKLQLWWAETDAWKTSTHHQNDISSDRELLLGYAYYHAIKIYLSGTYDYHVPWTSPGAPPAPILSRAEIDWHVCEILRLSQSLIAHGIAGIFLFFPLRVAGARATEITLRREILNAFHITSERGFIVADALVQDLSGLWSERDASR